jgi:2',3'-cyclic-nucleotide 2'-phosphodiesterase/3'-nucleotidase
MESQVRQSKIKIIFTTDVHGFYFPYDFRHARWCKGSLQRVHGYVAQQCKANPSGTILIDGGDMLQGEPTSYFFNYVAREEHHRVADICNYIGYDVSVVGNHDIETGHEVFDSYVDSCNFPILGANAISTLTNEPYFQPYTIIRRSGLKIAVIGFITAAIPQWIPHQIWSDMKFEGVKESAEKWIKIVQEKEEPDYIIGLFHSGMSEGIETEQYKENEVRDVAELVKGFDIILYGHDHSSNIEQIANPEGKKIWCLNPGCHAISVAEVDVIFDIDEKNKVLGTQTDAKIQYIGGLRNTNTIEYMRIFMKDFQAVKKYAEEKIGVFANRIDIQDAYFGSSAYIDLIQELQLYISGADISFSAPLFFNASIEAGEVSISNLFDISRFEDHLFTIEMTGKEIKDYLEMSYGGWINQMKSSDDLMLQIAPMKNKPDMMGFANFIFNFDSAAGIKYEVDVRKPVGERINILCMDDGQPFDMEHVYVVAMTAYRANGGGELLTKGAGLTKEEIEHRIKAMSKMDIRYYMLQYIKAKGIIEPKPRRHWMFVPEELTIPAIERERKILFERNKKESK